MQFLGGVASAIAHIHEKNVIHRDICASNILVAMGGDPVGPVGKVADFGLATLKEPEGRLLTAHVTQLGWRAPELVAYNLQLGMAAKCAYGAEVDMWSLGVLIHFVLTGGNDFVPRLLEDTHTRELTLLSILSRFNQSEVEDMFRRTGCAVCMHAEPAASVADGQCRHVDGSSKERIIARTIDALLQLDPRARPTARTVSEALLQHESVK